MSRIRVVAAGVSPMVAARTMSAAAGSSEGPGSAAGGTGPGSPSRMVKLAGVPGSEPHKVNDMLLLRPARPGAPLRTPEGTRDTEQHVVFFPGDIQNFMEEMVLHAEGIQWQNWSFERVALILGHHFPRHHVWVVRAARMYLHKFSSYCNFVESNLFGAPEHSADYGAVRHLRALLTNGLERAGLKSAASVFPPPGFSLVLVGFSKGCVVLNQIVHELERAQADPELAPFLSCVTDFYWLDGGHPGGSGTWVTEQHVLEVLAASRIALHAHVTPYEVRDPMRSWVGHEHRRFVQILKELGAPLSNTLHFEDEPASIDNHFRVIVEF
ncbi:hypothetical protein GN956_G20582 [Arapaima gigas]